MSSIRITICLEIWRSIAAALCAVVSLFNNSIRYEANNTTTYKHYKSIDEHSFKAQDEHWQYEGEHSTSEFRFQLGRTTQDALFDAAFRSEKVRYRHIIFRLGFVALASDE